MAGKPNIDYDALAADIMATREYHDAVQKIADVLAKARASSDPSGLTRATSPVALARARRLAETAAKSLAKDLTKAELKKVGDIIADSLLEGKRPRDIYNKLQDVQSLDSNRAKTLANMEKKLDKAGVDEATKEKLMAKEKQRLLQERRKTIAQTEGRYATSEARAAAADERKDEFKRWITSPDERLCEVCDGNENDGVIPINESFSSGDMHTPAHPNCRCTVAYLSGGKDKEISEKRVARKIAAKREARKIAAKQKAKEERQNVEELDK